MDTYRFTLKRNLAPLDLTHRVVVFHMLNPSVANKFKNDPTVTRTVHFTLAWQFSLLYVTNMFPYRATKPSDLVKAHANGVDIVKLDENMAAWNTIFSKADLVVCAWGNIPAKLQKLAPVKQFFDCLEEHKLTPHALGRNKSGHPKHPLHLPKDSKPEPMALSDQVLQVWMEYL